MTRHPWSDPDDEWCYETPAPMVHPEDRYVVAEILGPDGEVISQMMDRPIIPIGFAVGEREAELWVRF